MRLHRKMDPYIFLALPLLVYLAVVLIPIGATIFYSFVNWNGITEMTFAGLDNFKKVFYDKNLRTVFLNSLVYTGISTVLQVGIGLILAILIQRIKKGQNLIRVLLFVPVVLSGMAMSQTFKKLLSINPDGVVNALLEAIGLSGLKMPFLSDMHITLFVVAIIESLRFCGLYMVVFHSAFASIDREVLEAASIDGATSFQRLRFVELPMIRGIIINCVVLVLLGALKAFEMPFILTNGGPGLASEVMATYMYKTAFNTRDFGYSSVLSLIIVLECVTMFMLVNRITRKKE